MAIRLHKTISDSCLHGSKKVKVLALILVALSSFAYTSTAHDARAYKEDPAQFDVLRLCNKDLLLNCVGRITVSSAGVSVSGHM